jgi:hypothetical protein
LAVADAIPPRHATASTIDETTGDETTDFMAASTTAMIVATPPNVVPTWPVGRRSRTDHQRPSGSRSVR